MLLGLISGKSKYFGECVVFIALVVFVKSKINYTSVATLLKVAALGAVVIFFTWTKFNAYMWRASRRMLRLWRVRRRMKRV